jgi:hypothetical protein
MAELMVARMRRFFMTVFAASISTIFAANPANITYHGWKDALLLTNGLVEVVVVPSIGRVMQFRFAGKEDGPFWENRQIDGKQPDPSSSEWGNFGGDKTWPSPQSEWGRVTPRGWPPPVAFDSMPVTAQTGKGRIVLISPVDPHYGIRTRREIRLVRGKPRMTITTTYEKVEGKPLRAGVWIITQLKDPVTVLARIPKETMFKAGYNKQSGDLPLDLMFERPYLSMGRDRKTPHKVGTDASNLLWVGQDEMVRIDSARMPHGEYPDQGSSAEVYTNPDPNTYVELEMLGPLQDLKPGSKINQMNTYTLLSRKGPGMEDGKKELSRK